jgi:polysaccharide biosynthesis/export protein
MPGKVEPGLFTQNLLNSKKRADGARVGSSGLMLFLLAGALIVLCSVSIFGQTQPRPRVAPSDLARQNLSHVAASSGQLIAILHRDAGLMVELKQWIAKDATDHGQLISDDDLTDEAIFNRLETDITFRSQATLMVQKYGYLRPLLNPDSPLYEQQELLLRERVKWLAQEEGADRAKARQQQNYAAQQSQGCDPRLTINCPSQSATSPTSEPPVERPDDSQFPTQVPGMQTPQNSSPGSAPYGPPQRPTNDITELLRTGGQDPLLAEQTQPGSGFGTSPRSSQNADDTGSQSAPFSQRSNQTTARQDQFSDISGEESDASSNPDFSGGATSGSYPNVAPSNSLSNGELNSNGSYPSATSSSRFGNLNNSALRDSLLRARESVTPNQRMVRQPNPYNDIPSLYDMYLQASPRPPAVERFGMQVFQNGTRDLQMLPTDLPVGPDYVLGSGDALTVDLWGGVARRLYRVVDREGRISLPEAGPMMVAGKSLAEVQEAVQKTLRTQFRDVSADVSLSRLRTIRVYVVGDVLRPGPYDVGSLSTPLNALFAAGGPTGRGSLRLLDHRRGNQLIQEVDVYDLLLHGVKGDMQRLENGDTVVVPPLGPEVNVEGMVRRPAIYELHDEKSLAEAISLAGGLLPTATLRHIEVQRVVAYQKQTMLSLDIPQQDSTEAATKEMEAFHIQEGDRIRIFPIATFNQDAVYLEGHVQRPGKYSFHEGMRVTDLIGSYKDLLPEPASQYGEIIRLSQPDYRPTVQSFSLADVMADPSKAPVLQALDTVQIFGRYDFENPPDISVLGDVRMPGNYRTSGDIHLSDAIHLAGGLLPDAETADAQVFRYLPDSTLNILNVKLSSALEGSPLDNILLTPRDRVLVHRNAAAADPSTVYIKGEVARPGRYPLTGNMRISDLIRAAGGLKQSADTKTADLTHYLWKDDKQVTGKQDQIALAGLADNTEANGILNNGDVLSIRQLPGWDDLGASITIRGEVVHPGSFGIRPGERLSSVITRAGGFSQGAYPYGAVLFRSEVQKLEQRSYGELIQRVREQQVGLKLTATSTTDPDQKLSAESALVQWQSALDNLTNSPPTGRVTVQVSSNIRSWENTSRDITIRAGDILLVPKRPSYVLVQGQVYGPTAVAYRPGKSARWYLTQAGGTTNMANRRAIFVVRADGTVVGSHSSLWLTGDTLSVSLQPGDMVIAPEKALGGPPIWKILFQNVQILSSIATSVILASKY